MLAAFTLSLGQLGDRRILAVLGKSIAITLAVFAALGIGLWLAIAAWVTPAGGSVIAAVVAGVLAVLSLWLLFRLVALAVLQLFGDEVVRAVEERHYPAAAAAARPLGWRGELRVGFRGLLRALGYNLLALPVAFVLMATAIGPALVFGAINAVLLGRELTEMVALRHRDAAGKAPLPGLPTRTALGAVVVALLLVPLVNLIAPVIGAAMATHLVHRSRVA
jgi:uncharacterized protein involved in cysteine biosynthesis